MQVVDVYDVVDETVVRLNNIGDYFLESPVETVDLRDNEAESKFKEQQANLAAPRIEEPKVATENKEIEQEEEEAVADDELEMRRVRFQFDGELLLSMDVANDQVGASCSAADYLTESACDSLHVLRQGHHAEMTLLLKYKLKDDLFCDVASDDLPAWVKNYLGPSESEKRLWREYASLDDKVKALLDDCNAASGGCEHSIQHDEHGGRARVETVFVAGPPNVDGDYYRWVDFEVGGKDHKACFVLTGDYSLGDLKSFDLPSHEPLLVLRDPPGGQSYASYENVHTTMRVDSSSHEVHAGYALNFVAGGQARSKADICAGGGFGALVLACKDIVDGKAAVKGQMDTGSTFEAVSTADKEAGTFRATWSYQTSSDPYKAGHSSDVFLVPNLNVKFKDVDTISWNATQCDATKVRSAKFNIESPDSKPAFSFVRVQHIETFMIPEFERLLAGEEEDRKRETLQRGLDSWRKALADYKETNRKATVGALAPHNVPSRWFDVSANPQLGHSLEGASEYVHGLASEVDAWVGLAPADLVEQARPLPGEQQQGNLQDAHRIKFSGGGGTMSFSLSHDMLKQHVQKLGNAFENSDAKIDAGIKTDVDFKAVAGFVLLVDPSFDVDETLSHHGSKSTDSNTKVSFVLGDNDVYGTDEFTVDVYTDPIYGTFVFDTVGGQSRCPHEEGTVPAAEPKVVVYEEPKRPVLPDDIMVFKVLLGNTGEQSSKFELYIESQDNIGGLQVSAGGGSLAAKRIFELDSQEEIVTTVTLRRGPELFQYPPLEMLFRTYCGSECNRTIASAELYNEVKGGEKYIEFAEPCQKVFGREICGATRCLVLMRRKILKTFTPCQSRCSIRCIHWVPSLALSIRLVFSGCFFSTEKLATKAGKMRSC